MSGSDDDPLSDEDDTWSLHSEEELSGSMIPPELAEVSEVDEAAMDREDAEGAELPLASASELATLDEAADVTELRPSADEEENDDTDPLEESPTLSTPGKPSLDSALCELPSPSLDFELSESPEFERRL